MNQGSDLVGKAAPSELVADMALRNRCTLPESQVLLGSTTGISNSLYRQLTLLWVSYYEDASLTAGDIGKTPFRPNGPYSLRQALEGQR